MTARLPAFAADIAATLAERGAPLVGQHTRAVLKGLGYDEGKIAQLMEKQVIAETVN